MRSTSLFFSLLICLSSYAQPNPINRRAMAVSGLAAGPWTPLSAPQLIFWFRPEVGKYKADGTTPATNNNDEVYIWVDQSGFGSSVTNGVTSGCPTNKTSVLNGYSGVRWISGNNCLSNNITYGTHAYTVFAVVKWETSQGSPQYAHGSATGTYTLLQNFNGNLQILNANGSVLSANTVQLGIYLYVSGVLNGATSLLRTNGVQVGTGTVVNAAFGGLLLGNSPTGAARMIGSIVEMFGYTADYGFGSTLTSAEAYLKNKYGF